jgi:hypothetical protein
MAEHSCSDSGYGTADNLQCYVEMPRGTVQSAVTGAAVHCSQHNVSVNETEQRSMGNLKNVYVTPLCMKTKRDKRQ